VIIDVWKLVGPLVSVHRDDELCQWIREAIHIRKEQDKSMNRDEGS